MRVGPLLFYFVVGPIIGGAYAGVVHRFGAWVVAKLPDRVALALSHPLWRTRYDAERPVDFIRRAANRKRKRVGRAVEGEVLPR